ncbi:MAG TPA: tetratricopeptide repeat protein [Rhizomicrobium sp.]|jgi:tetratricopeptide (TPR) repeat protein
MRKTLILSTAFSLLAIPVFGMGGGGGGGYSGGGMSNSDPGYDAYAQALRLIKAEQFAEAIPYLNVALEKRPKSANILNYEGYTHRMIGDYNASLDYYNRALAIDPDHKGVHEYLGELYLQTKQPEKAQAELAVLGKLCPDGCDEKETLTASIAKYEAANPVAAPAPAAPATPG